MVLVAPDYASGWPTSIECITEFMAENLIYNGHWSLVNRVIAFNELSLALFTVCTLNSLFTARPHCMQCRAL